MAPRRTLLGIVVATGVAVGLLMSTPRAQETSPSAALVAEGVEALGGRDRVLALRTLRMIGYGEMIDGFGLSNISADRYSPERLNNLLEFERTFDLANDRMRTRVRRRTNF